MYCRYTIWIDRICASAETTACDILNRSIVVVACLLVVDISLPRGCLFPNLPLRYFIID